MNPETLKALKASIAHWKRMARNGVNGKDEPYWKQCALCITFYSNDSFDNPCAGCPVFEETIRSNCNGTPYFEARDLFEKAFHTGKDSQFKVAARKEVKFLESLLPASKKPRK